MKRESLNTSILSLHFQSRRDMLNHTGGTFSHKIMMDYPRVPVSKLNLGKFPDSMEFQSWKTNFRTEVCPRTDDPQIIMHWIKEVQITKSIDELVTSRSIVERTDFPDFDMLDAMITSALKKLLNTQVHFRKRVSVEEQRAQKVWPILGRKTNCAHDLWTFPCYRNLWSSTRTIRLVNFEFTEWRRPSFRRSMGSCTIISESNASDMIPEGLYSSKLQRLCSASRPSWSLYDQETARNKGKSNYSQLKTAVKLHIDQMMRTRKLQGSERCCGKRISKKGKKAFVERKVRERFPWMIHGQCSKGDSCQFQSWHNSLWLQWRRSETKRTIRSSSPAYHSRRKQTDGEGQKSSKRTVNKE